MKLVPTIVVSSLLCLLASCTDSREADYIPTTTQELPDTGKIVTDAGDHPEPSRKLQLQLSLKPKTLQVDEQQKLQATLQIKNTTDSAITLNDEHLTIVIRNSTNGIAWKGSLLQTAGNLADGTTALEPGADASKSWKILTEPAKANRLPTGAYAVSVLYDDGRHKSASQPASFELE